MSGYKYLKIEAYDKAYNRIDRVQIVIDETVTINTKLLNTLITANPVDKIKFTLMDEDCQQKINAKFSTSEIYTMDDVMGIDGVVYIFNMLTEEFKENEKI